jgi:hypothetical protein
MTSIDRSAGGRNDVTMTATTMTGTLRWIPIDQNGPTLPFGHTRLSAFAYVGDDRQNESALVVRGIERGATESSVEAEWVDGYPALTARMGDVITLVASQRPIATLALTMV